MNAGNGLDRVDPPVRIVVIGAGPSGVAMLGALVRQGLRGSVTMVDPLDPGFGIAFGTECAADPILVCNTGIGATTVDATNPDDLYDYLVEQGWAVCQDDSVPRHVIGEYARRRYLDYAAAGRGAGLSVRHVRARVSRIVPDGAGGYVVETDTGAPLEASHVINAVGLSVPVVPPELADALASPRVIRGAFPSGRLRAIASGSRVLVVGLRNSGVDAAIVLNDVGVHVTLTSPSGRISAVRNRLRRPLEPNLDLDLVRAALDPTDPEFIAKGREVLRDALGTVAGDSAYLPPTFEGSTVDELRVNSGLAESGEVPWTDLIFDGINAINAITASWTHDQRMTLVSQAFKALYRYAASIPHLSSVRLLAGIDAGLLDVSPQYLARVEADGEGVEVTWLDGSSERFDHLVVAAGYHAPRLTSPDGISVVVDVHGSGEGILGLDEELRARRPEAEEPERIWSLGAATNQRVLFAGVLWVAARQAVAIANSIAQDAADMKELVR